MNTLDPALPAASPVGTVAPREPRALQHLRTAALTGLALALTLLFGLWLLSRPSMRSVTEALGNTWSAALLPPDEKDNRVAMFVTVGLLPLLSVALILLAWRWKLRSWWWPVGGWLVVLPVFAYLAADEPSRRTIKLEEMAPAFPGAEKSYEVLMRYGKRQPVPEALAMEKVNFKIIPAPVGPDKPDELIAFLQKHRAHIESDWAALEPQRRWLDDVNAFDRIGDLGEASPAADIIRFSVWRLLSQRAALKSGLQVIDGQGDAAIETILPVLEASRKLEPSARTLVRFMVARIVQRMMIDAARFALERHTVSPVLQARIAAALRQGVGGEAGARRIVAVDYAGIAGWLSASSLGSGIGWDGKGGFGSALFDLLGPFVYNRERTINLHGDLIAELQEIAARRESAKIDLRAKEFWGNEGRPTFKNFGGRILNLKTFTPLGKVVDSYWKVEDKRLALLARLEQPGASR